MEQMFAQINQAYVNENNNMKALLLCERVINKYRDGKEPEHPYPFNVAVNVCIKLGELDVALDYVNEYLVKNPEDKVFLEMRNALLKKLNMYS